MLGLLSIYLYSILVNNPKRVIKCKRLHFIVLRIKSQVNLIIVCIFTTNTASPLD